MSMRWYSVSVLSNFEKRVAETIKEAIVQNSLHRQHSGIMSFASAGFGPRLTDDIGSRKNGVLISNAQGKAVSFALFNLQNRGRMMVKPNDVVYEGQTKQAGRKGRWGFE